MPLHARLDRDGQRGVLIRGLVRVDALRVAVAVLASAVLVVTVARTPRA